MWIALILTLALQDDAAAQSKKIVEKCWAAARPSLEKLGVKDLDAAMKAYLKSAAGFEQALAKLPKETRDLLDGAADPFQAVEEQNQKLPDKLWPPSIRDLVPRAEPTRLKDGEEAATMRKLVGTWKNEWKAARTTTTWTIASDGSVEEEVVRGDKTEKSSIKIDFAHELRVGVTRGTTRQDHTFLAVADGFHLSSNLLYDIHKVTDRKRFTFASEWDWLVAEDGAVTVIGDSGASAKAVAAWAAEAGGHLLKLKWRYAGKKFDGTRTYAGVGEYLVHASAQLYKKQ